MFDYCFPCDLVSGEPTPYYLEHREKFFKRRQEFEELQKLFGPFKRQKSSVQLKSRRREVAFAPTRRSLRVSKKLNYSQEDGSDNDGNYFGDSDDSFDPNELSSDFEDERSLFPYYQLLPEQAVVRRRTSLTPRAGPPAPLPIENVTESLLSKIATSSKKIYASNGTTCHQCRQKTLDTKTVCRSGVCIGVRGQFCQQCLVNHYGQNVKDALLDPDWKCPCCRDICNCSICRTRQRKVPLGIVIHAARAKGFSNVHEFLESVEDRKHRTKVDKIDYDDDDVVHDGDSNNESMCSVIDDHDGDNNNESMCSVIDDHDSANPGDYDTETQEEGDEDGYCDVDEESDSKENEDLSPLTTDKLIEVGHYVSFAKKRDWVFDKNNIPVAYNVKTRQKYDSKKIKTTRLTFETFERQMSHILVPE